MNRAGQKWGGMLGLDTAADTFFFALATAGQSWSGYLSTPGGLTHFCPRVLHTLPTSPCLRHVPSSTYHQRGQEPIGGVSPYNVPRVCVRVRQGQQPHLGPCSPGIFQRHIRNPMHLGEGKPPEDRVRFLSLEFAALFPLQVAAGERKTQRPR